MWTADSLEKTLMLGKLEGQEKGETEDDSMDMSLSKLPEIVEDKETWCSAFMTSKRVKHDLMTEQQQCPKYIVARSF